MQTHGKSRRATGVALLILLTTFSHPLWSQAADESGTLVMVARTANAVIVSVDSKVTTHTANLPPPESPATPIDGDRKLVNVGEHSSCAIDGFLGKNEAGFDVSALMRLWIAANPKTEAREAMNALLDAAEGPWDRQGFTLAEISAQIQPRKIGSPITKITCGEFVDGHPIIVRGQTYVRSDGFGGQVAEKRTLNSEGGDVLYIGGEFDTAYFEGLVNPPFMPVVIGTSLPNESDRSMRNDLRANHSAMTAFVDWQTANERSRIIRDKTSSNGAPSYPPSTWTEASFGRRSQFRQRRETEQRENSSVMWAA